MATGKQSATLTENELEFWDKAFLVADLAALVKGGVEDLKPEGLAHLASDYATAAVIQRRRVIKGQPS